MRKIDFPPDFDKEQFAQRGEEIYRRKYKEKYEPIAKGKVLAIEIESENAFLADSVVQAAMMGRQKYPD